VKTLIARENHEIGWLTNQGIDC